MSGRRTLIYFSSFTAIRRFQYNKNVSDSWNSGRNVEMKYMYMTEAMTIDEEGALWEGWNLDTYG